MFSDRDAKVVLKHVNDLGEDVQIINIFPMGSKIVVVYKTKEEKKKLKQG